MQVHYVYKAMYLQLLAMNGREDVTGTVAKGYTVATLPGRGARNPPAHPQKETRPALLTSESITLS